MQTHGVETHLFVHELLAGDFSLGRPQLQTAGRGRGVFAISLACRRRRRIADSRRTPPQPELADHTQGSRKI